MIDKDKQYRTRDGREVRIYATDGRGLSPIHGAVKDGDGWASCLWNANGGTWIERETQLDLVEVRPRIKRKAWVNVYRGRPGVGVHYSREQADQSAFVGRIACVEIDIDCEEGRGL